MRDIQKEADHSRLVAGGFSKQENLNTRLVLGSHKNKYFSAPACQVDVYRELRAHNGIQSYIQSERSQQHITLLRSLP